MKLKALNITILLVVTLLPFAATDEAQSLPAEWKMKHDSGNLYVDDRYKIRLSIVWPEGKRKDSLLALAYQPPEGRELIRIERNDFISLSHEGKPRAAKTIFNIYLSVTSYSEDINGKLTVYRQQSGEEYKIEDKPITGKILNLFTYNQILLIIAALLLLAVAVFLLAGYLRGKKQRKKDNAKKRFDRFRLDINALGRLLDNDELDLFVNQSKAYLDKIINDKPTAISVKDEQKTYDVEMIDDADLKRNLQKSEKLLYDARFSGKGLTRDNAELIYSVCESLYKIREQKQFN